MLAFVIFTILSVFIAIVMIIGEIVYEVKTKSKFDLAFWIGTISFLLLLIAIEILLIYGVTIS